MSVGGSVATIAKLQLLTFSPGGDRLASASEDGTALVWDTERSFREMNRTLAKRLARFFRLVCRVRTVFRGLLVRFLSSKPIAAICQRPKEQYGN